jgi:hypothetical protein
MPTEVLGVGRNRASARGGWNPRYVVVCGKQVSKRVGELEGALVPRVYVGNIVGVVRVRDGVRGQHHRDEDGRWW